MIRRNREIAIFSLSALDLFASAMGAFVLLSVMMLPFYFKGKEFETEIGNLELALADSTAAADAAAENVADAAARVDAVDAAATVAAAAERQAIADEQARRQALARSKADLAARIAAAEAELAAASPAAPVGENKVTFRFLGLKTDAERYLILVDGARRIKDRADNLPAVLQKTVSVLGPNKEFAIAFYNNVGGRLNYARWPATGFRRGGPQSLQQADAFMRAQYGAMDGGSATLAALEKAVGEGAEAIVFISDGFILPAFNRDLRWPDVVRAVTRANTGKVEINTVAIGIAYRRPEFWGFLNALRRANDGDLKMVPP